VTPTQLTVSLTHADGPLGHPPRLKLSLYLSGLRLNDGVQARGTRAGSQEFPVTAAQFEELCRTAEATGFPIRLPEVEGKNDTSDRWAQVLLFLSLDGAAQTLDLSLLSSGFEGPDAPALRRFFSVLLSVAGVQDESIRFDLVGP
jgi:hypothetical protein